MYRLSSSSSPSWELGTSSIGKHLLAKAHITKLSKLPVSELPKLTSSTVDETAVAILKRQESRGIPIVSSQRKFKFTIQIVNILTELTDKMIKTSSKGLSKCWISPGHRESLPYISICFSSYSMECDINPRATTFIQCIMKQVGVMVSQHPKQYSPEGIHTDRGCNSEAIGVKKQSQFSLRLMDINKQSRNNIGHSQLYGSELGIARSTTGIWWG